jgi:hypothetical protein
MLLILMRNHHFSIAAFKKFWKYGVLANILKSEAVGGRTKQRAVIG